MRKPKETKSHVAQGNRVATHCRLQREKRAMAPINTMNGRILLVDDDSIGVDMLRRRLAKRGFDIKVALCGQQALDQIEQHEFDIVLLDFNMPEMDGLTVLRHLREKFSEAELPVIMVTAQTEKTLHALEDGANDFLTKPFNFKLMLARIKTQLASKRAYDALKESEQRYALAMEGANDGLWDWSLADEQIYFSPQWMNMLGYHEYELEHRLDTWLERLHPEDRGHFDQSLQSHLKGDSISLQGEYRIMHKDGSYRWMAYKGRAVRDKNSEPQRLIGSQRDITEDKVKDPLTGLSSRLLFKHRLKCSFERKKRNPDYQYAVMFLDLDQFKMINDSLGHAIGDELLKEAAKRIESCVRAVDMVARNNSPHVLARMGGDEFTILLEDIRQATDVTIIAERIKNVLAAPFMLKGREIYVSTSIGISLSEGDAQYDTPDDLLRDADTAMYHAKSKGRGRYELFDREMHTRAIERLELETALRQAVQEEQFCVHYQPILNLSKGNIQGFEALVRWQHPTKGLISPAKFIPIAEESGLITNIGMWVFRESCRQLKAWHDAGHTELGININLSRKQFFATNLLKECTTTLEQLHLDARHVTFEVTESSVMNNKGRELKLLHALKDIGLNLSMDDFGTGYSSLSLLRELPFDSIKLDRSFIDKMDSNDREARLVNHIVSLAQELGLSVTAEGIEREKQLELLRQMECPRAQGYLFSKPLPHADASLLLQQNPTW